MGLAAIQSWGCRFGEMPAHESAMSEFAHLTCLSFRVSYMEVEHKDMLSKDTPTHVHAMI